MPFATRPRFMLGLLTLVYVFNFVDRQLLGILAQPIKAELHLTDRQLGLLGGFAFALFYTALGLPIARLAERGRRVTIVAVSLASWSAMTALTGIVHGFVGLFLLRVAVGIGEAGCAPPSQSLIAAVTPPGRRATALAIFSLGVPIGMLASAVGGGWIAGALGWRLAFVALGLPGLAVAVIVALTLREPARSVAAAPPAFGRVVGMLRGNRAFLHMAAGASLASFAGYGLTYFAVPLLIRAYGLDLRTAATGFGLVVGAALAIGMLAGGWASDRWAPRNAAAPGLVSAAGMLLAAPLFLLALGQRDPLSMAGAAFVPFVAAHLYFGPTYAVTAASVPADARATAVAILLLAMNAIGLGLGPTTVGALSDHFAGLALPHFAGLCGTTTSARCAAASATGLATALRIDLLVYLWAALHFWLAARALRRSSA